MPRASLPTSSSWNCPAVGQHVEVGEELSSLESVKAVGYVYAPIAGTVAAVNEQLSRQPELVNQDPYGEGWIVRLTPDDPEQSTDLMDAAAYLAKIREQADVAAERGGGGHRDQSGGGGV